MIHESIKLNQEIQTHSLSNRSKIDKLRDKPFTPTIACDDKYYSFENRNFLEGKLQKVKNAIHKMDIKCIENRFDYEPKIF